MTKLQKFHVVQMPQLRVVPTEQVILHESFDTKRTTKLKKKIIESGKWKDPPIVTRLQDGRYMVVDGANRTTSMKALNIPHMLVQEVDYFDPSIRLKSWNHAVRLPIDELTEVLKRDTRISLRRMTDTQAKKLLSKRKILGYLCGRNGTAFALPIQKSASEALSVLNCLADEYEGKSVIHRTEDSTHRAFHGLSKQMKTLVVYPALTKKGILSAIERGQYLPSGISRHLVLRRALRVWLPLSVLRSRTLTLRQKQARVDALIAKLFKEGKVRYYPEGIYLFDE